MGLLGSIAGGLLGIGASSIQNSQNRQNVRETNQMNYKINQMNNQFNERMAIQQRNWQENMWNKENAYNTASAQRQRLEEAGLNPYLMMNGGSAGVAQSAGTGATASSSGNAVMQPFQADYSGIGSSIGNIFQYELMQSEKSQLQGARQLADAQAMETLSNIDWGKLTDATRNYLKSTGLARAQLGYAKEQQEADNMAMTGLIMRAQRSGMLLDNEAKGILNKYLDQQQQLDLNVKAADYYQRMSAGYVSYAEAKKAIAEEALAAARGAAGGESGAWQRKRKELLAQQRFAGAGVGNFRRAAGRKCCGGAARQRLRGSGRLRPSGRIPRRTCPPDERRDPRLRHERQRAARPLHERTH